MRFFLLFVLIFFPILLSAQEPVSVSGRVQDEFAHPIPGVLVILTGAGKDQTVTDSEGRFQFSVVTGKIKLSLTMEGFRPLESEFDITAPVRLVLTMSVFNSENMVVTASRVITSILDSPSTNSVLAKEKIEHSPALNYADLLRSLPGVNANQISARVFRITTRQVATAGRVPSELVMVDGRTLNIDLNGAAGWDTIPVDTSQIERIEVVHGPASAVWGPNAQTGAVNIITKTPGELAGTTVSFSGGFFDRDVEGASDSGNGHLYSTNFVRGQVLNERLALKISAGIFGQDSFARPVGTIPIDPDRNTGGAPYPAFDNLGTTQPKFDFRLDQQLSNEGRLSYSGGVAWTEGTGHTASGPARILPGSYIGYVKAAYEKNEQYFHFFSDRVNVVNAFDFVRDASGNLIEGLYTSQDYVFEGGDSLLIGNRHLLTFGGNLRILDFDLSLAPDQHDRNQIGAYLQDEFNLDRFRFVVGGRVDKFNVTDTIFSPRLAAIFRVSQSHSVRTSLSRAFRPPTLLESYQDLALTLSVLNLGQFDPALAGTNFPMTADFVGNPDLREESTTAFEVGYTGIIQNKTTMSAAFYVNKNDNNIRNTTTAVYSPTNVPENWPLSPELFAALASQGIVFPSNLTFVNTGPIRYQGFEVSLEHRHNSNLSFFTNYTYQSNPKALEATNPFPQNQLYQPPHHHFNVGMDVSFNKYFSNGNLQYVSDAFWTDVLNPRFWGPTNAYAMVNVAFGRKWNDGKIVTALNITNLFNKEVQQHVFGDIIKRTVSLECRLIF